MNDIANSSGVDPIVEERWMEAKADPFRISKDLWDMYTPPERACLRELASSLHVEILFTDDPLPNPQKRDRDPE
jgi:hypothetical protein